MIRRLERCSRRAVEEAGGVARSRPQLEAEAEAVGQEPLARLARRQEESQESSLGAPKHPDETIQQALH